MYINKAVTKQAIAQHQWKDDSVVLEICDVIETIPTVNLGLINENDKKRIREDLLYDLQAILKDRIANNDKHSDGNHLDIWMGMYRGRGDAYHDMLNIVTCMLEKE